MNKTFLIFLVFLFPLFSSATFSQFIPFNPSNYTVTYSDEFNGSRNAEWTPLLGDSQPWGNQTFSSNSKYLTYGTSGSRQFLELKAYIENDGGILKNFSAGLIIPVVVWDGSASVPNPDNPFYYGYYEIEAKLTKGDQSMDNIGLWPAFWFQHNGQNDPIPGKYWYEEVDIFEPGACYVKDNLHVVHYWTLQDDDAPLSKTNTWLDPEHEGVTSVDMFDWHKYGVEWLPDRLTFYVDNIPFHTVQNRVPFHDRPQLFIDLQLSPDPDNIGSYCHNHRTSADKFIGSFQVNYFKYYAIPACNGSITESVGTNYNFSGWSNSLNNTREYCIFKNTSIPSNSNIIIRAKNYVELKDNFTVPYGAVLEIRPTPCQ